MDNTRYKLSDQGRLALTNAFMKCLLEEANLQEILEGYDFLVLHDNIIGVENPIDEVHLDFAKTEEDTPSDEEGELIALRDRVAELEAQVERLAGWGRPDL